MRKIALQSHVLRINSNARICGNVLKKPINVTESLTVTMDQMNLVAHRWNQINVIKKSISVARPPGFAFQLLGTAMDPTTAMIIQMKKTVDLFRAQTTSISVKTQNAFSKLTYAMEKTIVAIILMNLTNMLALHHHSDAQLVNGSALE